DRDRIGLHPRRFLNGPLEQLRRGGRPLPGVVVFGLLLVLHAGHRAALEAQRNLLERGHAGSPDQPRGQALPQGGERRRALLLSVHRALLTSWRPWPPFVCAAPASASRRFRRARGRGGARTTSLAPRAPAGRSC